MRGCHLTELLDGLVPMYGLALPFSTCLHAIYIPYVYTVHTPSVGTQGYPSVMRGRTVVGRKPVPTGELFACNSRIKLISRGHTNTRNQEKHNRT